MTSRFSTLQNRDARPVRAPEPAPTQHHAVVIPTTRKLAAASPEPGPPRPPTRSSTHARACTGC